MDIKDLANVSTVVINSLLMLLKDNHVDLESVVMQLSNNNDEALSPDVNLMELTQQTLGELKKAKASVPEGFVLVPKEPTDKTIAHMTNTPIEVNLLCDHADTFLSEGEACIAYQAMIEAQEPAPLKLGDLVEPIDHRYTLASGCERYPYAYVVNTNPFQLMSEEGDMYWCCTVEAGGYKLIKSNDQLPEAVSLRMIREGLLAPVEAQEQSHENG